MKNSKEKSQNSHSKPIKKLRETNSYKIQFKTKVKQKSNINSKEKDKNKKKSNKYSQSNISVKTYNQKPSSSLIKEYNSNPQINNNAISYSNYALSEMEQSKKNDNNLFQTSKFNNEDYNTLLNSYNKMDINDLTNTNNKKNTIIEKDNNNYQISYNNQENMSKHLFPKKAAYSMFNENEKNFEQFSYNLSNNIKNYKYETSIKRFDELNNKLDKNNIKTLNLEEENNRNFMKNKNELKQYINSDSNKNSENNYNNINQINNDNLDLNNNINNQNNYMQYQRDKTKLNDNNNLLNFNYNTKNFNGQGNSLKNIYEKNIKSLGADNFSSNDNLEIYNDLEEKLKKLHCKIHKNSGEIQSETYQSINDLPNYENLLTYPSLKRYRQKSEPSLRINKNEPDYNLTVNSNMLRRKKSEKNIIPPHLIIKYPSDENNNKNLKNLRLLEENIKTESSTKKMIDILLNQQNNPELKNILSELQITIKKLPRNEDKKEDNSITTQPANYFFPFGITKIERINGLKNNSNFDVSDDITKINRNRKIEKLKSKLNEFQEIMNKKPRNKNYLNVEPKNNTNFNYLNFIKNKKVYTNLCPANNLENDLFYLENK